MTYRIFYKRRAQWSVILGAGFLGFVSIVAFCVALAEGADLEFGFVAGCLGLGIGGPIYAYVKYVETSSGLAVIDADASGLTILSYPEPRRILWSQVKGISYQPDRGRKTMSIDVQGVGIVRNSRGTNVAVALQQHEIAGRTKDHVDALTRLWKNAATEQGVHTADDP